MKSEVKHAASQFLLATYGFDEATRAALIDKACVEILSNCRELLADIEHHAPLPAKRCAHRLKGNLRALGLTSLAGQAQVIEATAVPDADDALLTLAQDLYRSLADIPRG